MKTETIPGEPVEFAVQYEETRKQVLVVLTSLAGYDETVDVSKHPDLVDVARTLLANINKGEAIPVWLQQFAQRVSTLPRDEWVSLFNKELARQGRIAMRAPVWDFEAGLRRPSSSLPPIIGDDSLTIVKGDSFTLSFGNDGAGKTTFFGPVVGAALALPGYESVLGVPTHPIENHAERGVLVLLLDRPGEALENFLRHHDAEGNRLYDHPRVTVWLGEIDGLMDGDQTILRQFVNGLSAHTGIDYGLAIIDNLQTAYGNTSEPAVGAKAGSAVNALLSDRRIPYGIVQANKVGEPTSRAHAAADRILLGHAGAQHSWYHKEGWPRERTRLRIYKPPVDAKESVIEVTLDLETGHPHLRETAAKVDLGGFPESGRFTARDLCSFRSLDWSNRTVRQRVYRELERAADAGFLHRDGTKGRGRDAAQAYRRAS